MHRIADSLSRFASVVRRVIGAPDYERYLSHVRMAHPGTEPVSREQFVREAMARRYGKGASRCC
jgi:uncharacterized short protein YbdD (DUF466 family)